MKYILKMFFQFLILVITCYFPGHILLNITVFSEETNHVLRSIIVLTPFMIISFIIIRDRIKARRNGNIDI